MADLTQKLKKRLRISTDTLNEEIEDLVNSCKNDLKLSGIQGSEEDPLYYQAIVLYLKTHFGNNDQSERFEQAYLSLKVAMALSGDYENGQKQCDTTYQNRECG